MSGSVARYLFFLLFFVVMLSEYSGAQATDLSISSVYESGSVWQRDQALTLMGKASTGATIAFDGGQVYGKLSAYTTADGRWSLSLPLKPAGGPYTFSLSDGSITITLSDIYLGDVYILSGQSNMEWLVQNTDNASSAVAKTDPMLRHFAVPKLAEPSPKQDFPVIGWESAKPTKTENFSAIGYYFAEALRETNPGVAIGLINSSWGGSRIEAWLPLANQTTRLTREIPPYKKSLWKAIQQTYPQAFSNEGKAKAPHLSGGSATTLGGMWEANGFPDIDGVMWFDREVELTASEAASPAILNLGAIDDSDSTYFNSMLVGTTYNAYAKTRRYSIPTSSLKSGINALSVLVEDTGGGGGLYSPVDSIYLITSERKIPLGERGWRIRPVRMTIDSIGQLNQVPTLLYNGMLHPLEGVKSSGVLWYQGESNAGSREEGLQYGGQLVSLVKTFRSLSGQPQLPFIAVELPEFMTAVDEPFQEYAWWPYIRQSTRAILPMGNTSTVVAFGYGDPLDIHPRNKRPIGIMLANEVRRIVYGQEGGPVFAREKSFEQRNMRPEIIFTGAGSGLKTIDGGPIKGFTIQDDTGKWHAVEADIVTDNVIRLSPPVGITATAVAYAWSNTPDEANLINGWGLRVGSFLMTKNE